jgi:O-antigen/teichoic acid export membrane protein/O-antigen ligase
VHQHPESFGPLEAVTAPEALPTDGRTATARGVLWLSVSSWGAKGTQTVVLLVLAKALTPSQFGVLAVAALTYNVLLALNHLGVVDALTYFKDRVEEASRTALSIVLMSGFALVGVTWALAPLIAHFFHSPGATFVLRGFALGIPFDVAAQVPVGRLTRELSFARRTVTDSLPSVIAAAVTISVVISGYPLIGLVAGQVAGSISNLIIAMIVGPSCLPGWNSVMARKLLRYGGYLSGADVLNLGLLNVDYIIVGHVLGPVALGLYSLAYRICFMPYLSISVVANGAVFPYYCRLPSRDAQARAAENVLSLITAASIPWFAGLALFAGQVALLGNKWAPAAGAIRFLAVYGLFLSLILSALQVLKAMGRTDLVFLGRCLHLVILVPVLLVTARAGITIVALDQAVVACLMVLVAGVWLIRHASLRPIALGRSLGPPVMCALPMVLIVLVLSRLPGLGTIPSWKSLLALGSLALSVFVATSLLVMRGQLRTGWAVMRGRSDDVTDVPPPVARSANRRPGFAAGAVLVALALVASIITGRWTLLTVAAIVAIAVLGLILSRPDIAVAILAADFFFNAYLAHGAGIITVDKGVGAIAVAAWGLDWAVKRRPILTTPQLWLIIAFLLWTAVSICFAVSLKAALVISLRYVMFATLFFLVLQTVRGDRRRADVLVRILIIAAAMASIIGLIAFFSHHVLRASGPIHDPNDFAFILGSSTPLAIYLIRWGPTRWSKLRWGLALAVILACTLVTFSRSALTGLAVAALWLLATRRLRLRWLLGTIVLLAVSAAAALLFAPRVVQTAFAQKSHVAGANISDRLAFYRVELNEWEHYPVTGVGPGNFVYRVYQYGPATRESLPYPYDVLTVSGEEAYLVILAEQGAVGLALFLGYLALSWADLRRRFPDDKRGDQLQTALAAGFVVACVGALFLTEQYYPPLWFLAAVGASLARGRPRAETEERGLVASGDLGTETLVAGRRQ